MQVLSGWETEAGASMPALGPDRGHDTRKDLAAARSRVPPAPSVNVSWDHA